MLPDFNPNQHLHEKTVWGIETGEQITNLSTPGKITKGNETLTYRTWISLIFRFARILKCNLGAFQMESRISKPSGPT